MNRRRSRGVALLVGLFGLVLGAVSGSFPTRALFQTLILAQASLLAIVVSVSLLSVQTSQFAPLLSSLYRESTFERLFGKFGISILADVALLAVPTTAGGPVRGLAVGVALGFAAWSFVSLFEIEHHMTAFLNPEPVLSDLVEGISYERYREFSERHRERGRIERNPLLEIVQVAQTALDARDNYGALQAIAALQDGTIRIVEDYNTSGSSGRDPLHKLFDYWNQVTRTAIDRGADDVLHHVVEAQTTVATRAIELNLPEICDSATDSLEVLCEGAIHADRIEREYVEAFGEVLVAAVDDDSMVAAEMVVDHLEGLCETVETAEAVDREVLSVVGIQLLRGQRRLVEAHPEAIVEERHARAYASIESAVDRCVGDLLVTSADVNEVGAALRDVGVAAAGADHQWIVRRIATRIIDLDAAAEGRYADADEHVDAIYSAGGEDGVDTAFDYVRDVYGDGQPRPFDDPVARLE